MGSVRKPLEMPDTEWSTAKPRKVNLNRQGPLHVEVRANILEYYDQLKDISRLSDGYCLNEVLPGPLKDVGNGKRYKNKRHVLEDLAEAAVNGLSHVSWMDLQKRYCHGKSTANFVIPIVSFTQNNSRPPVITDLVILSHPDDCERIARAHVKKMPDQGIFLGDGVLSTTDVDMWREQRSHFIESFLPNASLANVFPVNLARVQKSMKNLEDMVNTTSDRVINMNEFLLYEAMAQLQLSLFGLSESFMDETNVPLRRAFDSVAEATGVISGGNGKYMDAKTVTTQATYAATWIARYIKRTQGKVGVSEAKDITQPEENSSSGCPMRGLAGPLSARIADGDNMYENAATFVFAGHDTTANTMTWLLFEVSQNKNLQQRLQQEADEFFARTNGNIQYDDLKSLPLLGRCILETLRLWPVVPNGTFRELLFDDVVVGPNGQPVKVPKGTYVQITNWMRHRSPELWGPDAGVFNPDREFTEKELGSGLPMAGFNPSSARFSPFTYGPRDCMGRNFAQMEMRVILLHLFHNFKFELGGTTARYNPDTFLGINRGTMGPQDLGKTEGAPSLALQLQVTPRRDTQVAVPGLQSKL
eukprot:m.121292 g.121292  ORF g.121292 m.121292 type:complete len:588 (-) comp14386_c0_seq5:2725-4488(-)